MTPGYLEPSAWALAGALNISAEGRMLVGELFWAPSVHEQG